LTSEKLPLSAYVICLNEIEYLGNCIESLQCCKEIVIVDSGSKDGTLELIEKYKSDGYPIKFIHNDWPGYAAQKQFALEQCSEPWCLSIDSDERLDEILKNELTSSAGALHDAPSSLAMGTRQNGLASAKIYA